MNYISILKNERSKSEYSLDKDLTSIGKSLKALRYIFVKKILLMLCRGWNGGGRTRDHLLATVQISDSGSLDGGRDGKAEKGKDLRTLSETESTGFAEIRRRK